MRKILHIHQSLNLGGIETLIVELCNGLDKSKYNVNVCVLSNQHVLSNDLSNDVIFKSLNYSLRDLSGVRLLFNSLSIIRKLGSLLKIIRPSVIHIHSYFTIYLIVALAAKIYLRDVVVVKTVHTSGLFYNSSKLSDWLRLSVEQFATYLNKTIIVGVSGPVYNRCCDLFKKYADDVVLIHNGVNVDKFSCRPNIQLRESIIEEKQLIAIYVARLDYGKNHLFLIELWRELISMGVTNTKLLFVGNGPLYDGLRTQVDHNNLSSYVQLLGETKEVNVLLSIADFAVFPSEFEGFGLSLVEKMSSSLPVVASDIPPFKEIIENGINGYTIPITNKEIWLDTIKRLINDSFLREYIGQNARRRSLDFSIEKMISKYDALYV